MKAITIPAFGGTEQLTYTELPNPVPASTEVLVQVKAISINPVDVKTRAGKGVAGRLKDQLPLVLGWDISGVVTEVGAEVSTFKPGDEVFGMVNFPGLGNAYAEYVAAPADHLAKKPASVSHEEAAATTLAALTAYQSFVKKALLLSGQTVLIHAAAGGVGHFAVQLAKQLGAYVIGTSSEENREFVLSLGADEHIDYKAQKFEEAVSPVDFVLDTVGGENLERSLRVVKPGGTLISIPTSVSPAVSQQATDRGIHAFFFLVQSSGEDMQALASLLEEGTLKPFLQPYEFSQMAEAHTQQETGKTKGKIVLTVS